MNRIKNTIAKWVLGEYSSINPFKGKSQLHDFSEPRETFADVLFMNIVEGLTDLTNDTTLLLKKGDVSKFADLKVFFDTDSQRLLNRLFIKGFVVVIGQTTGLAILEDNEYSIDSNGNVNLKGTKYRGCPVYVVKSDCYTTNGMSDRAMLNGWLKYVENVMNASNTTTARLGSVIMASPKPQSSMNTGASLTVAEKEKIETDISENYGGLKSQKQILIWQKPMDFVTINLAALDNKVIDKAKFAVTVIADRLKFPANQVALIESTSNSNSLASGTQVQEGDLLKYKTFERLINKTFVRMAEDLELIIDFTIYNKPTQQTEVSPTTPPII